MEFLNIDPFLPVNFRHTNLIHKNTEKCITFRCNIKNSDEVKEWIGEFSKRSATSYILRSSHGETYKFEYT